MTSSRSLPHDSSMTGFNCPSPTLTYPTKLRFLSLTDTCIHYLIHHPEIPVLSLPLELQEHIEKRKEDSHYRVIPMYSVDKYQIFRTAIFVYVDRMENTTGKGDKINLVLEMIKVIDDDLDSLRYIWKFGARVREKLIDLPSAGFPLPVSKRYLLKWFDYKLVLPPPLFPPRPLQSLPLQIKT